MLEDDFLFYVNKFIAEATRKGSIVLHVNVLQKDERLVFDELPDQTLYQDIILSTTTATGEVQRPTTNHTLNVYLPSLVGNDEINVITFKMSSISR